jgi:hypothetical protein
MKVTQISIFLENRKGRLFEVTRLLGKSGINIRALNIAETDDFGVLRLVVDKPEEALSVLKTGGFVANTTDIVAVEVPDRPGGLSEVLSVISEKGLNVEYMYGFVEKKTDQALLVFRFDNTEKALSALKAGRIRIVAETDIQSL